MAPPGGRATAEATERVRAWRQAREQAGKLAPHPAPEVPCRLAVAEEMGQRAKALQRAAQGSGWRVQVTYARGNGVHGRTGKPTSVVDSIAVRCWGPGGRRLVMCWTKPASAKSGWTESLGLWWSSVDPLGTVTCDVAISRLRDTVESNLLNSPCDEGEEMAEKVAEDVNLFQAGSGKRAYGKISWSGMADGDTWKLTKAEDWPDIKTAGQVVDMAKRFAARESKAANGEWHYVLKYRAEGETVWVRFEKMDGPDPDAKAEEPAETQDPFQAEAEPANA